MKVRYWVGFDVGKAFHWACVLDDEGEVILSRRVEATERDLEDCCEEIAALGGERMVATDLLGGPAALLEAILLDRGPRGGARSPEEPGTSDAHEGRLALWGPSARYLAPRSVAPCPRRPALRGAG